MDAFASHWLAMRLHEANCDDDFTPIDEWLLMRAQQA